MSLQILKSIYEQRIGKQQQLLENLKAAKTKIKTQKKYLKQTEKALEIVKIVGLETQKSLQYHIGDITSLALESVFEDPYKLEIDFVERRNKSECDLMFEKNGDKINPLSASGGGAVDIAAFALRIASWSMKTPKLRPVIILDEPMKNLDKDRIVKGSEMLQEVSNKLGLQFIIVTHEESLTTNADKIFKIKLKNGKSKIA